MTVDNTKVASGNDSLGRQRGEYGTGSLTHIFLIGVCLLFFLLFGGLFVHFFHKGQSIAFFFGGFSAVALAGLIVASLRLRWRIVLFDNGFVLHRCGGCQTVRWTEVKYLRQADHSVNGIPTGPDVRIEMESGTKIKFDSCFRNIGVLVAETRTQVNACVLRNARERLRRNEPVQFGKLAMHSEGLDNGKEELRWHDVDGIRFAFTGMCHKLIIRKTGRRSPWYQQITPFFPNFETFIVLLRELAGQKLDDSGLS